MKNFSKFLSAAALTLVLSTTFSCKNENKEVEEYNVTEETLTTKEELTTTATDTAVVR